MNQAAAPGRGALYDLEDPPPGDSGGGGPAAGGRGALSFLAPKEVLERFLADLRSEGLEVSEDPLIPGVLLTCRLKPRNLQ